MVPESQASRLIKHIERREMVRPRDLAAIGVDRRVLKRLVDHGQLTQRSRGVYTLADHEPTRHTGMAEVCARAPSATVCLISALDYHELTTQIAHSVWIMINRNGRRPRIEHPPIEIVYASGPSLTAGVQMHKIEGVNVRITSPAKTVADCFKYRDRVGLDVAVESLRDCLRRRKATPGEVFEMAKIDRVAKIIRPYIQALT